MTSSFTCGLGRCSEPNEHASNVRIRCPLDGRLLLVAGAVLLAGRVVTGAGGGSGPGSEVTDAAGHGTVASRPSGPTPEQHQQAIDEVLRFLRVEAPAAGEPVGITPTAWSDDESNVLGVAVDITFARPFELPLGLPVSAPRREGADDARSWFESVPNDARRATSHVVGFYRLDTGSVAYFVTVDLPPPRG